MLVQCGPHAIRPLTPVSEASASKRAFDRLLATWRKQLHEAAQQALALGMGASGADGMRYAVQASTDFHDSPCLDSGSSQGRIDCGTSDIAIASNVVSNQGRQKIACRFYAKGTCTKGADCAFKH